MANILQLHYFVINSPEPETSFRVNRFTLFFGLIQSRRTDFDIQSVDHKEPNTVYLINISKDISKNTGLVLGKSDLHY